MKSKNHDLLNKNFLLLLQGQMISHIGHFVYMAGLIFWLKKSTDSTMIIGLFLMSATLPGVLLGPLGGAFADRYPRKYIVVLGDVINGCLILALAGMMFFTPGETHIIITLLFIVAISGGIIGAFFGPAVSATIPDLVSKKRVKLANGILQGGMQVAMLVGQSLGGVLFMLLGAPVLMLVNGISYLLSALSEAFIVFPKKSYAKPRGWISNVREIKTDIFDGLSFVRKKPGLRDLLLSTAVRYFFMAPVWTLLPFFVENTLKSTPNWYGYLMATQAFGMILGSALAATINVPPKHNGKLFLFVFFLFGGSVCIFGYSSSTNIALIEVLFIGGCIGFMGVLINSTVQMNTPSEIRGRVFGVMTTLSSGLIPISMGLSGVVADLLGQNMSLIYSISGACVLVVAFFLIFSKGFHLLLSYEEHHEVEN